MYGGPFLQLYVPRHHRKKEEHMKPVLYLALLSLIIFSPARAQEYESAFQIVRILVVGVETPSGLRSTRPSAYFSAFKVLEYDV
jgi:hypothetical protein